MRHGAVRVTRQDCGYLVRNAKDVKLDEVVSSHVLSVLCFRYLPLDLQSLCHRSRVACNVLCVVQLYQLSIR